MPAIILREHFTAPLVGMWPWKVNEEDAQFVLLRTAERYGALADGVSSATSGLVWLAFADDQSAKAAQSDLHQAQLLELSDLLVADSPSTVTSLTLSSSPAFRPPSILTAASPLPLRL
ncbi:hypothetical protein JCM11251_005702 [Rhodosporidiobolus azoricus]